MRVTFTLAFLAACGASPPATHPPSDAAPAAPAPVPEARCYDAAAPPIPTFEIRPAGRVCDTAARTLLVEHAITVFDRPTMTPVSAPISRTESLPNRCGDDAFAGCSITYDRYWSPALGSKYVELGTNQGDLLLDDADPNWSEECREVHGARTLATCSTGKHFAVVSFAEDPGCSRVHGSLWSGADAVPVETTGDGGASGDHQWTFRFADFALVLDGAARTGALEVHGEREDCAITSVSP